MKSLFKRVLATATGSVLLVSQLAATGININAADSASGTILDKAWITDVPVDTELFPLPAIDELPVVIEGDESAAEAVPWGESIWNDQFHTAINTIVGDKDFVEKSFVGQKVRDLVIRNLANTTYFTKAEATELANGVSVLDVKVAVDKATAEISIDGVNERIGAVAEDALTRRGIKFVNADGDPVVIDWNKFPLFGAGFVEVDYSKFDKTATYNVTFTDGEKDYDGYDAFADYITEKFNAAVDFIADEATAQNAPKLASDIQKYRGRFDTLKAETESVIDAVEAINFTSDDPAAAYDTYKAAFEDAVKNADVTERYANRAAAEFYRIPANLDAILKGERGTAWIQYAIDAAKQYANDKVTIDLSAGDFAAILDEGYEYEITVPNGFSADVEFKLADDKNSDVFDAIEEAYADQWADEGYELVSVTSHKEVTLNAETNKLVDSEKLFYDVVRIIDEVVLKKVEETTTTTTEESTEETTTTTTEESTEETTTTTTEESTEETTTTTTESSSEETTTTTTEESTEETTTTTTESSTEESTTTTTESSSEETTTTTTESTTEKPFETTTEESSDTEPTTTTTTGTDVIIDNYKYELSFDADGMADELVYWSEETTEFDFSKLEVLMKLTKTNINDGTATTKTFDVSEAFGGKQTNPQDFEFTGFGTYGLQIVLKDAAAVEAMLRNEVVDAEGNPDEAGLAKLVNAYDVTDGRMADTKGQIPVVLVLRGDFDLDNKVDYYDASMVLTMFTMLGSSKMTMDQIVTDGTLLLNFGDDVSSVIKYAHYAGDVDGDGILFASDASDILSYATTRYSAHIEDATIADFAGDVTPLEKLHSEPMAYERQN